MDKVKDRTLITERKKLRKQKFKATNLCAKSLQNDDIRINIKDMTLEELFKWVESFNHNDSQTDKESTEEYIARLLQTYKEKLKSVTDSFISDTNTWDQLLNDIDNLNGTIAECFKLYSHAKIADSISKMYEIMKEKDKLLQLLVSKDIKNDKNWYRMRNQEEGKRVFPANEMFHVPFNLRHKVSLARYSVSGYPCLYISRSIWATWEEMHEPKLSDFTVSRLELQQDFRVLDLRVPIVEDDKDPSWLTKQLYTIPLILACSVKVKYPKDNFKPEYIMPQLVMLAITYPDVEFMGCAYTSTMRNSVFPWADIRLLDNIALPVFSVNTTGKLCPKLCSLFKVSDSTNYDFEMLKKPFDTLFWTVIKENAVIDETEKYSSSIFGQIEKRLAKKSVVQLNPA